MDSEDIKGEMSIGPESNQKPQMKKRKSYSPASEMLGFLREYGEKHEKVEEEKLNLMKTMEQEKK